MKKLFLLLAGVTILHSLSFAQTPLYKDYSWQDAPTVYKVDDKVKDFPAFVVKHYRFTELVVSSPEPYSLVTEHKIIHVNSDAGIEKFNKVYIPFSEGKQLLDLKVRAIAPDGRITNFRKENLKELQNVEGYGNFKIFAVEGLTLGGELEYLYTLKGHPQSYGREIFQFSIPVVESAFELVYPSRLNFSLKSYNGLTKPVEDAIDEKRKTLVVRANNIPALEEEEYSAYKASLMRLDFRLESNGSSGGVVSWNHLSQNILKSLYDPKGAVKAGKLVSSLNVKGKGLEEQVRAVEQFIKINFTLKEGHTAAYEDVKEIISSHVGNERGITKLYMSCFEELGITPELVLSGDRYNGAIDQYFPSPMNLRELLFYFPQFRKYLTPGARHTRLGPAPDNIAGTNGLFINYATENHAVSMIRYDIKSIEPLDFSHNILGVKAVVKFGDKIENPDIEQENFWQGYRACAYRGYYADAPENKRGDFIKDVTITDLENFSVVTQKVEGESIELSADPDSYMRIKTNYKAPSIVERAGDDYLISVGKLIGKQSELYQEKQRKTDVVFNSISNYNHELTINIPAGYTCSGLEGINISNAVDLDKKVVMKFESSYQVVDNTLTIKVNEVYKVLNLPREKYEAFRKVVNSAADFNKLVIILHPSK